MNEPRARAYARRATRAPCTFTFTITRRDRDARPGPATPARRPATWPAATAQRKEVIVPVTIQSGDNGKKEASAYRKE